MEHDYFTLYLYQYLLTDFPDLCGKLTEDELQQLIRERAKQAAVAFEEERLLGKDVLSAQETAIHTLTEGLTFSAYQFVLTLMETNFYPDLQRLKETQTLTSFLLDTVGILEKLILKHEEAETGESQRLYYHLLISQLETLIQTHGV